MRRIALIFYLHRIIINLAADVASSDKGSRGGNMSLSPTFLENIVLLILTALITGFGILTS